MNRIAIIGGSGFVGHNLTELLINKGYSVTVLDKIKPKLDVEFRNTDIKDKKILINNLKNIDTVIHLAALVGVDSCRLNEDEVIEINFEGTKNVVEACKENKITKLLFSSSSEVYGDGITCPFEEKDVKLPKSAYGKAKLKSEEYLRKEATETFTVRVVRYFNVYGPSQRTDFVINKFLDRAYNQLEISIYGDGLQTRCFSYITDIVNGTHLALMHEGNFYEDFNIGNDSPVTINKLAEKIINTLGSKSEIRHIPFGKNGVREESIEIYRRIPSISKAQSFLGYYPEVSLEQGLMKVIGERFGNKISVS